MKQFKADIVVISGGTAGLTAALTAAEGGASVIVMEKSARTGGTANHAGGIFAVESRLQRIKRYTLTREEAFRMYMDFNHWRVDARLVKTFIDKSADTLDWLENMGVEFLDISSHNAGFHHTWHVVNGPLPGPFPLGPASAMMDIIKKRAEKLGVEIFLKTTVKKIIKENGRITGVEAEDGSGEVVRAEARAVITATGGFSGGTLPGLPGVVGTGTYMAREAGAATVEPANLPKKGGAVNIWRFGYSIPAAFQQPNLVVNLHGERFMNEEIMATSPFSGNAIDRQKDHVAFIIFDEETRCCYAERGLDLAGGDFIHPLTKIPEFYEDMRQALEHGADNVFIANSPEELAEKTGINRDGLLNTIAEYNLACETGRDKVFYKKTRYLRPVKQPKFYASKTNGDARIWGGIKINYKTEALNDEDDVIPGLYAAGMDAAINVFYDTYPFILPAVAMGFAVNSGRMAAESALQYVKAGVK